MDITQQLWPDLDVVTDKICVVSVWESSRYSLGFI